MNPVELLGVAETLLGKPVDDPGVAERAAALLARQALEMTIAELLKPFGLRATDVDFTSQLICLQGTMADKELARETAAIWATLSGVLHVNGLELSPTETEVLAMVRRTRAVLASLRKKL